MASLFVSRLLKMERLLNHICIPCELGYPTIEKALMSIGRVRHDVALHFWQICRQKVVDGAASSRPRWTLKDLKAEEIEMELTDVYGDEAFQISAVTKWRTCVLQGRTEPGDDPRSGILANSDLTQVIAELIRECSFLSCKISCRDL